MLVRGNVLVARSARSSTLRGLERARIMSCILLGLGLRETS
jgi:hypothetical protein